MITICVGKVASREVSDPKEAALDDDDDAPYVRLVRRFIWILRHVGCALCLEFKTRWVCLVVHCVCG